MIDYSDSSRIGFGTIFGILMDNISIGIGIGLAIGLALATISDKKKK